MRTLGWLIALLVNFGVIGAFAPTAFVGDVVSLFVSSLFAATGTLLIAARVGRLPFWSHIAMKLLCLAIPVSALLGSLDYGIISRQEFLSIIAAMLLGWGTWRAFLLFAPMPNPAVNTDAVR